MGLELANPIIVGACNLVMDLENLKKIEAAGAGAVVYKSLFEEQIHLETLEMDDNMEVNSERHAEMTSIFPKVEHAGPKEYLMNLKMAIDAVEIPVIASLNAVYKESWIDYAKKIEEAGANAIELNFYSTPDDFRKPGSTIEQEQLVILQEIKKILKIPVSVKLSSFYSNPLNIISKMDETGVDAFVLFNNLFQPEIDIDAESHHFQWNLSNPGDSRLTLRFAGILYDNIKADICSNTGVLSGKEAIQLFLAGATAIQIVSTVYQHGINHITKIHDEIQRWMDQKQYSSLSDFRGKLSMKHVKDPFVYKRAQYVDILWNSNEIFKKYPLV